MLLASCAVSLLLQKLMLLVRQGAEAKPKCFGVQDVQVRWHACPDTDCCLHVVKCLQMVFAGSSLFSSMSIHTLRSSQT